MGGWIDLTKSLDDATETYAEGRYRDPDFSARLWSDHAVQGYEVWRLELGTQTGTHIDAPRHFDPNGATIDALCPEQCVGTYQLVTVGELAEHAARAPDWASVTVLVLDARPTNAASRARSTNTVPAARSTDSPREPMDRAEPAKRPPLELTPEAVEAVAAHPCRVIVVIGEVMVAHPDPFYFHRRIAECGKYLVEDTREDVGILPREGQIIALPLRLIGLSGSPARVLIRGH